MATIQDVSPTRASTSLPTQRFVTGRMLSLDSSDDGKLIVAGSLSSNLWVSEDGGESWVAPEARLPPVSVVRFAA